MRWTKLSTQDSRECAAHHGDCPLNDMHDEDPWVLDIAPKWHPGDWVCPDAAKEIMQFSDEVDEKREANNNGAGLTLSDTAEQIVIMAFRKEGWNREAELTEMSGLESLEFDLLDGATHCITENLDELPREAERTRDKINEFLESY